MKLNEVADKAGARSKRKRVGRGIGSGVGKTGGRGVKGQKSRSGVAIKGFEGGQMPLTRRLPKRGFNNIFRKDLNTVSVGRIQQAIDAGKLDAGSVVDLNALVASRIVRRPKDGVRLLSDGAITAAVQFEVTGASKAAVAAVEAAGGTVTIKATKPAKADAAEAESAGGDAE
ncbi:MAG: 50S ribosomal protein L15 [Pseudomonadota bacterium]